MTREEEESAVDRAFQDAYKNKTVLCSKPKTECESLYAEMEKRAVRAEFLLDSARKMADYRREVVAEKEAIITFLEEELERARG